MRERWRRINWAKGYYEISDCGRLVNRNTGVYRRFRKYQNYLRISLRDKSGRLVTTSIHKLVARAFIGPCPTGMEVNHKDGIKKHNFWKNLEYKTHAKNMEHAAEHNLMRKGKNHPLFGKKGSDHPGFGYKHTIAAKKKISKRHRGKNHPFYGSPPNHPWWGRSHSEETKRKIGLANKGKIISQKQRERLRIFHTGRKHSPETRAKMRVARAAYLSREKSD